MLDEVQKIAGWSEVAKRLWDEDTAAGVRLKVMLLPRWARHILHALVETTLSRDILLMTRVDKPVLLRQLLRLGCDYSGQVLSYQKMLGQLQDVGNTASLAHYLDLTSGTGMLVGLQKFSGARVRQRGSSPKLLVMNTALATAASPRVLQEAREDATVWAGSWSRPLEPIW